MCLLASDLHFMPIAVVALAKSLSSYTLTLQNYTASLYLVDLLFHSFTCKDRPVPSHLSSALTYIPHTHTKTILEASLSTQPIFLPHFLECLFLSFCWESAININQILFTTSQLTTWVFFLMRCTLMMFA